MTKIKLIQTHEYDKINYKDLGISRNQAQQFKIFLLQKGLSKALDFQLDYICTNSYVGTIKYKDFQLNILPKILGDKDSDCLKNLAFMLKYTNKLTIHNINFAQLERLSNNPFLEFLIAHYAKILLDTLNLHIPHHYESYEDNLPTIKGRILFSKHFKVNCANQAKTYCQFDEFTPNNLLNQTLKFVAHALAQLTKVKETRNKLLKILAIYDDVVLKSISYSQTKKILLNKNQIRFKDSLDLAKLFLQHSTISLHDHNFNNLAILFDMNLLFEEFVSVALEKIFPGKVQIQARHTIIKDIAGLPNTSYTIKPDILLGINTIIDTKYKILDLPERKPAESDIYQMLAYSKFYERKNIILCYPVYKQHYNKKTTILKDDKCHISLITLDLHQRLTDSFVKELFYNAFNAF